MRLALRALGLILLLAVISIVAIIGLVDTQWGHNQIIARIESQSPKSGLRIKVGRIDGSLYSNFILRDLEFADPEGGFLNISEAQVRWAPLDWFDNKINIAHIHAPNAILRRQPRLASTGSSGLKLPDYDIKIERFSIDRIEIAEAVTGKAQIGRAAGTVDIQDKKARIFSDINADQGDQIALRLEASPEANLFDIDARINAPAGGLIGSLAGVKVPVDARVNGSGNWNEWTGRADVHNNKQTLADLGLTARNGNYGARGKIFLSHLLNGKAQRLTAPTVLIDAEGRFNDRIFNGRASAASPALALVADGIIDLRSGRWQGVRFDVRLLNPNALFANMRGRDVRLSGILDGPFQTARFDYALTAPQVAFDATMINGLRATGQGRLTGAPVPFSIVATATSISGLGGDLDTLVRNVRLEGALSTSPRLLTGKGLALQTDRMNGKVALAVDLLTARYTVNSQINLPRYAIPGYGVVDVAADLRATPGANGRSLNLEGQARAETRQINDRFIAGLAGGMPQLSSGFMRGPDGLIRLNGLRVTGPNLELSGNGLRLRDGSIQIMAKGRQDEYGPVNLRLNGRLAQPSITALLDTPLPQLGLRGVTLSLQPNGSGFDWIANGQSSAGPFAARGAIPRSDGKRTRIAISDINLSGLHAAGDLTPLTGGVDGSLGLTGGGMKGVLQFDISRGVQRILANVQARNARLDPLISFSAERADFDGVILLDPKGLSMDGTLSGEAIRYNQTTVERAAGNVTMKGGTGEFRGSIAGTRGRTFELQTVARFTPSKIEAIAEGTVDNRPLKIASPVSLVREAQGWRFAPVQIEFAGGKADIGGRIRGNGSEFAGKVNSMPLAALDMVVPGTGLDGDASGSFALNLPANGLPSGQADLRIAGLSRKGLVLASKPIDMGVAAILKDGKGGARLVAVSEGQTIGRAQVQLSNIPAKGAIYDRLTNASLFGQLRYSGPSDTLWRLSGVENFDLSGTIAVGADIRGTPNKPEIKGSAKTTNARIESLTSGLVLSNVEAAGQFDGSRLIIEKLSGKSGKDGKVTGTGQIDFAGATRGIDIRLDAERAPLLDRDDIAATVSGPIRIKSDGESGVISGDVRMERSYFRLGQASVAQIPKLNVRDITPSEDSQRDRPQGKPWRLKIDAKAKDRLLVTGLGIDSEWQADLKIDGTIESPGILGTAELIKGDYEFAGKRFALDRGIIRFRGTSPPDPVLDIQASGDTQGIKSTIRVSGTGNQPEIAFSSIPALPQDELLSRMLFGTSITNLSAPEAVQLAAAVAAMRNGGTGLNPINELRRVVGLDRLRILPADVATGQRTAVAAGKYIGRRTYVELVTDGQGYTATRAEFQITRWLSVLSTISTIGKQSARVRISKDY